MARLTIELYKILRSAGDYNLDDPDEIREAALASIFNTPALTASLNKLGNNKNFFITGFCYHFFAREIGQETEQLWKMSLTDKLYNNTDYINEIYDYLKNQLYAEYRTRKLNHEGDNTRNTANASATSNDTTNNRINTTDAENNHTGAEYHTNLSNGEENDSRNRNENGYNARYNTGENEGTTDATNDRAGANTDTSTTASSNESTATNKSNAEANYFDTPQGGGTNIRTPNSDITGMGISAVVNTQYNYHTSANTNDATSITDNEGSNDDASAAVHTIDESTTDHSENASTSNNTEAASDARSSDETGTRTHENTDAGSRADNSHDTNNTTNNEASIGSTDGTSAGVTDEIGHDESEDREEQAFVSLEMLMQTGPVINKIWQLFEPCFSMIL